MASRPLVLPDSFNGETSWDEWIYHFGSVSEVNDWNGEQKLKWLKVRMISRAQKAVQHLPVEARGDFERATEALRERFEPESKRSRYEAEFQSRRKKKTEGWADFGEDLKTLADKAYSKLGEEGRERLALNSYLGQIDNPQVAFAVSSMDAAISSTLEMESYLVSKAGSAPVSGVELGEEQAVVAAADVSEKLATLVEKLSVRIDQLERQATSANRGRREPDRGRERRSFAGECWRCGRTGHTARFCCAALPSRQGN